MQALIWYLKIDVLFLYVTRVLFLSRSNLLTRSKNSINVPPKLDVALCLVQFPSHRLTATAQRLHIQIALMMRPLLETNSKRTLRGTVTSVSRTSNRQSLDEEKLKLLSKKCQHWWLCGRELKERNLWPAPRLWVAHTSLLRPLVISSQHLCVGSFQLQIRENLIQPGLCIKKRMTLHS